MKLRLSLAALLALLAAACSDHDQASRTTAGASAASASAGNAALAAGAAYARAPGYANRFAAAPDHGALVVYPAAPVVRQDGAYTSYAASISEAHARDAIGGVLTVPLPNGEQLRFRYQRHVEHENGDWTWIGDAIGAKGEQAIVTFGDKAAFGTIGQAGEQPWRLTVQNGASWLIRTDAAKVALIDNEATRPTSPDYLVPPGQIAGLHRSASSGAMSTASATAASATTGTAANTVDLVIGYTPGFVSMLGGDSQAQTRLNNMVDITNQAYVNSAVDARVRLVKTLLVSYADNTSNDSALEGLTGFKAPSTQTTPDPAFSALRAARDQYGADLVSLVRRFQTPENAGCGIAWLIGGGKQTINSSHEFFGYSVVSDGRDLDTDGHTYYCREETLAHELGHNMGSQHDRATAQGDDGSLTDDEYGTFPYSFGYKTTSTTGNFYTIMAYGDSGQTSYRIFSNPRTTFCGGLACGVDNQSDNARSLGQTIPIVATFRATVVPSDPGTPPAAAYADLDGNGKSDLFWRFNQTVSGNLRWWLMNGASPSSTGSDSLSVLYTLSAVGDFNGDGKADLVWTRSSTLEAVMWLRTSTGFTKTSLGHYTSGWSLVGAGDFDGNGKDDLVWRYNQSVSGNLAIWKMSGTTVSSVQYDTLGVSYRLAAIGDFDGDQKADIAWIAPTALKTVMWRSSGSAFVKSLLGSGTYTSGWTLIAAGDFNADGKDDLVWRYNQSVTGNLQIWRMNGATVSGTTSDTLGISYRVASVADFNGDGRADIAWTAPNALKAVTWLTGSTGTYTKTSMGTYDSGWTVVDPNVHNP